MTQNHGLHYIEPNPRGKVGHSCVCVWLNNPLFEMEESGNTFWLCFALNYPHFKFKGFREIFNCEKSLGFKGLGLGLRVKKEQANKTCASYGAITI